MGVQADDESIGVGNDGHEAAFLVFRGSRPAASAGADPGRSHHETGLWMSHNRACSRELDSLLIRSPRWAEDSADHLAQADTSLPRHSDRGTVRRRVTLERCGRHHSQQPMPDQPPQDSQSGMSRSSGWAGVGTPMFGRPRPLSRHRRASDLCTLICEEPLHKLLPDCFASSRQLPKGCALSGS